MRNCKIQQYVRVTGTELSYPETVLYGKKEGKRVTVSAGVHSREEVGIEALNRLAEKLDPEMIRGELRLIHAVNYSGLIRRSPDVCPEDGKNLNRVFPGCGTGTSTQRLAAFLEKEVILHSDMIIDLHSGSCFEELVPHVYFHSVCAPDINRMSEEIARHVSVPYIVRSKAKNGFYSHAGQCGVPAVIIERGGRGLWTQEEVQEDMCDVKNILRFFGVLEDGISPVRHEPLCFADGRYEDAPVSGCWYPFRKAGDPVRKGEVLGEIRDVFGHVLYTHRAEEDGVLLYQTVSLGIEKGSPMTAYGIRPE